MAQAAVEAACRFIPGRSREEELQRIAKAVKQNLPKGQIAQEAYETAVAILQKHFLGTRDLYAFGENPVALADELIRRSGRRLTATVGGFTRQCLQAVIAGFQACPAEVQDLERLFRTDVRVRLEQLQRDATADRAMLDHLARWARTDVLHDPRATFRRQRARFDDRHPARLLDARAARVPFFGRERELADFEAWLEDEADFAVWTIAGPGGIGKTRLMLEALDRAGAQSWRAGFLRIGLDVRDVEAAADALFADERPTLVVIDYAEDRPGLTAALLARWLDEGATKRRVVLLCRRHDLLRDALDRLTHETTAARDVRDYLAGADVHRFTEEALGLPYERRRAAFAEAQAAFAQAGAGPEEGTPHPVDALSDDFFSQAHFGQSLYLYAAAYTSLFGPPKVRRGELLGFVLERERDHLTRLLAREPHLAAIPLTGADVLPALALATLALAARSDVSEHPALPEPDVFLSGGGLGDLNERARRALRRLLARTYPHPLGGEGYMDALRPDPLGEALVFQAVNENPDLLATAFGPTLDAAAFDSAATVLYRTALAFPSEGEGEEWLHDRLEQADVLGRVAVVDAFLRQIPFTTTGFARFTIMLAEGRAAYTRERLEAAPDEESTLTAHAAAVGALSTRYANLGRRKDALEAAEEAVDIRRRLVEYDPDAFEPILAISLNNLANRYDDLGWYESAALVAEEAVDICRRLDQRKPSAFLPNLALCLTTLGVMYSNLHRYPEALEVAKEAVTIHRHLAEHKPDAFLPRLAGSLGNLSLTYSRQYRDEEALKPAEEAVDIERILTERNPDTFLPSLAQSLSNFSAVHLRLSRRESALEAIEEAVDIRRLLAERTPNTFEPDLALSLGGLGEVLLSDNPVGAADAFREGIQLLTPYFIQYQTAFVNVMTALRQHYLRACRVAGMPPDRELLAPLLPYFQPPDAESEA